MKKMFAIVSLLVVGLLVGCGGEKPKAAPQADPIKMTEAMKAATGGLVDDGTKKAEGDAAKTPAGDEGGTGEEKKGDEGAKEPAKEDATEPAKEPAKEDAKEAEGDK